MPERGPGAVDRETEMVSPWLFSSTARRSSFCICVTGRHVAVERKGTHTPGHKSEMLSAVERGSRLALSGTRTTTGAGCRPARFLAACERSSAVDGFVVGVEVSETSSA